MSFKTKADRAGLVPLSITVMLTAIVACLASCVERKASDVERGVSRPQNLEQLLGNIKAAFDGNLFLEQGFYGDRRLMTFFNGASVQWHTFRLPLKQEAIITPNPSLIGIKTVDVMIGKSGKSIVGSGINVELAANSGLTLGAIRKVFGRETDTMLNVEPDHPVAANVYMPSSYPAITYIKLIPSEGAGGHLGREEVQFGTDADWRRYLGPRAPTPKSFPDGANVMSIRLDIRME